MSAVDAAAARMDRIYRRQRFIYDVTRRYYLLGRDRMLADLAPGDGHVLEIGCGTGRNLAILARRHAKACVYGIDVSAEMLDSARAALVRAGVAGRVRTALADATSFDPRSILGRATFDRVYFSYTLSMIPAWSAALEQAVRCLGEDGRLLIVDFGQQERLPGWFRRLLFAWLALFHVHPIADLERTLDALGRAHGLVVQYRSLFRGYAIYASLERVAPVP